MGLKKKGSGSFRTPLCAWALFASLAADAAAMAQEAVARLKTVSGEVHVSRDNKIARVLAGAPLFSGDIVITEGDGSAGITFTDGSRVSMGPDSELRINRYRFAPIQQDYAFDLYLRKGSAAFSTGKFGKLAPGAVQINTPQAAVGIRGTKFLIKVE